MNATLTILLLTVLPVLADVPSAPPPETERVHNFASLSWSEVAQLHGRRAKFRIKLNSEADSEAGRVMYECLGKDGIDRTVQFVGGHEVEDDQNEIIVEATFHIARFEAWAAPDGMRFPGFTEYRLEDARDRRAGSRLGGGPLRAYRPLAPRLDGGDPRIVGRYLGELLTLRSSLPPPSRLALVPARARSVESEY